MIHSARHYRVPPTLLAGLLLAVLALASVRCSAASQTQWTVFVYMLADNNLESFGMLDLEEIMYSMSMERPSDCMTTVCGEDCPTGRVETYKVACSGGGSQRRCCSPGNYPDVLVYVDRGQGTPLPQRMFDLPHADYSLLESYWTNVRTLVALPGGQWQQITQEDEVDMAQPQTIANFLQDALTRYPPSSSRKYMLVFWDHGNGWIGYGADARCTSYQQYSEAYCDMASLAAITQGLKAGLVHPQTGQPVKMDIIGFDACLMAMYEVGSVLAPYANYLLGSELLEPGTGWDYTMLSALVTGNPGLSEKALADLIISGYMESWATGLTMALMDLRTVESRLETSMGALSTALVQQMKVTPALSMQVLQQRMLLGTFDGADNNIDLGALLTRLSAVTKGDLKTQLNTTLADYRSVVVSYDRDAILPDGTGMAIYFPPASIGMDGMYPSFVNTDPALSGWFTFLKGLYDAIGSIGSTSDFSFQESYAVPYWAVASNTWITHGTLTTLAGLTADLMYGFLSPTGRDYIVAGTTVGRIAQAAAVGAWSGQLFGLVQDLTPGDGAVDGLALAYADEQRLTDSEGNVQQLILQMQVYYAKSCYAAVSDMTPGMLKYSYNLATKDTSLQLFVSSGSNKAWGEVAPAAGGVIIPYLGTIDLTGARLGQGSCFGYSDCLKWGYQGSIMVAAFNATQAVGILGLDLTRDLATMLTVQGLNGRVRALYGAFEPAQKTQAGCQCAQLWSYKNAASQDVMVSGQCVNPYGHDRAWCKYEPESCTGTPTKVDGQDLTDFCAPVTTLSGCKCHPHWRYGGIDYYGNCTNSGDPKGSWCVVDRTTCGAFRAHEFGPANTTSATINGSQAQLTGLDFDYCQVTTTNKCHCSNTWDYSGTRYSGTCRTGMYGNSTVPGISPDSNWCFVDKGCAAGKRLDGFTYDLCTPEGGRVTEDGTPCQFPASYHGVPLYDCISYNHSTPGVVTARPWCFTNTGTGAWGYCAPWTCTAALKANCPVGSPNSNASWSAPSCLETLCNARKDLANISLCTQDSKADRDLLVGAYSSLTNDASFGQLLGSTTGSGSLDAYCSKNFGYLCMDNILDPACPGLWRQDNVWMASKSTDQLCDVGCLKAMCRLQEQAKTSVTGTPGVSGNISQITCADSELTTSVMWSLMRLIDATCGWPGPASLACNKLLSPPQLCAADTQITAVAGNFTDGTPLDGNYSASTECSWTINLPDQPYISLNFTRMSTEPLYDVVTVEDFDGLIGRFSGNTLPPSLSTDTGVVRVKFTTDGSLQGQGFAAAYLASSNPQTNIPTCTGGTKLLQVVLRTRGYGSELSWLLAKSSLLNVVFAPTPNEANIVMAGGALPASVRSKVPEAVASTADTEYKDYRSYYSYACLATGSYNLFTYDSYGDGWEGGRITLTQIVNATTGCVLLSGAAPKASNMTTPVTITADADTNSAACSALTSPDGPYSYVEAGLVLMAEETHTFTLAKQRKLKEALATLLDVDAAQVTLQSLSNATAQELTDGQNSLAGTASSRGGGARGDSNGPTVGLRDKAAAATAAYGVPVRHGDGVKPASRRLQAATATGAGADGDRLGDSIHDMLQEQQQQHMALMGGGGESAVVAGTSRAQALSRLAVSIPDLVASGWLGTSQQQLMHAEQWLLEQQQQQQQKGLNTPHSVQSAVATTAPAAAVTVTGMRTPPSVQGSDVGLGCTDVASGCTTSASSAAADEAQVEAAAAAEAAASAAAVAVTHEAATAEAAAAVLLYAQAEQPLLAESRKLQQLLPVTDAGEWQDTPADNTTTLADGNGSEGPDGSSSSHPGGTGIILAPASDAVASALLAEKPLGPSAGSAPASGPTHSHLMQQLQSQTPVKLLQQQARLVEPGSIPAILDSSGTNIIKASSNNAVRSPGSRGWAVPQVVVGFTGGILRDAFRQPRSAAAVTNTSAGGVQAGRSTASSVAAVPKPEQPGPAAARASDSTAASPAPLVVAGEVSYVPQSLPFVPQVEGSTGGDNNTLIMFDAIRPGRTLTQVTAEGDSSSSSRHADSSGGSSSSSLDVSNTDMLLSDLQPGLLVGPAQVDPGVLAAMIAAGRRQPVSNTRPRPSPQALRPPGTKRRLTNTNTGSSSSSSNGQLSNKQPKKQEADVAAGPLPLPWPGQSAAGGVATGPEAAGSSSTGSAQHRQLLQTNSPSRGVTVVLRVNGYSTADQAAAAATALDSIVKNGSLQSTLAAQGWPDVTVGVLYTKSGSVSVWSQPDILRIIIGACVGGGGLLCIIAIMWYARRRRQAGAAQMPPGAGGPAAAPGGRMSAIGPTGGRMSAVSTHPAYLPPQQAAAVVVPYPSSPYGRSASPSAPLLLSPSQQAAFASTPAPHGGSSPYGMHMPQGGRASVGPAYPSMSPGGYGGVAVLGGSYTGPAPSQQQPNYYPVYPAPSPSQPYNIAVPATGRSSPYGAAAAPAVGYPVIAPPGGLARQQQQQH